MKLIVPFLAVVARCCGSVLATEFEVSFTAGARDAAGVFMGGTEMRTFATHVGRLYAGNGYWMDRPGDEDAQGAQVLVLDGPNKTWRVERSLDEKLPGGRRRHLAVSALLSATFATNGAGQKLPKNASMLLTGTWDLSGLSEVFVRDDASGTWAASPLPVARATKGIQQVRALAFHTDRKTGVDCVFAGNSPHGIFRGTCEANAMGPSPLG